MRRFLLLAVVIATIGSICRPATAADVPPANDNFANATAITSVPAHLGSETNIGATEETGEPAVSTSRGASVWYSWQAPKSRDYIIDLCASPADFDSFIAVYTGTSFATLQSIASDDEGCGTSLGPSKIAFVATKDTVYKIAVYSFDDGLGFETSNFDLKLTEGTGGLYISNPRMYEGDKGKHAISFMLTLGAPATANVTGHWYSRDCDGFFVCSPVATQGVDYIGSNGNFKILKGKRTAKISFLVIGDKAYESNEYFQLLLSNVQGTTQVNPSGLAAIVNDDVGPDA